MRNSNLRSESRLHGLQLVDPVRFSTNRRLNRSVWSLVAYWNRLPKDVVYSKDVKEFQRLLQSGSKDAVRQGCSFEDLCALHFLKKKNHVRYGVETHT